RADRPDAPRFEQPPRQRRQEDKREEQDREDVPQIHRRAEDIRKASGYTGRVDLSDWYWLGVAAGLGVATGVAFNWMQARLALPLAAVAFVLAALAGVFVAFLV